MRLNYELFNAPIHPLVLQLVDRRRSPKRTSGYLRFLNLYRDLHTKLESPIALFSWTVSATANYEIVELGPLFVDRYLLWYR
jgi:hypothetical protein